MVSDLLTMFIGPLISEHLSVIQTTASFIARQRISGVSINRWCSPYNIDLSTSLNLKSLKTDLNYDAKSI